MSLYLKYRPQSFSSLVGQAHAKKTIQSSLNSGSLAHAYLFCGPRGTGKTSMARIVAKALNCLTPKETEPCNECNICTSINNGRLVDLIEIDAASNRGIDEIRELREKIVFAPSQAKTKVYIIDEVHMLTKEAFNALLKTLEEPPSHAYFVLATTEAHKIPETIISRCQQFTFSRIEVSDITTRLQEILSSEGGEADEEGLELIAKISNGGLRDAIGLLEQMMASGKVTREGVSKHLGLTGIDHLEQFFNHLVDRKALKAIELVKQIKSGGQSISQFLKEIISYMREQLLINLSSSNESANILEFIEIFMQAKKQLDLSPIPELPVEMAIIKACQFQVDDSPEPQKKAEPVTQVKKEEPLSTPAKEEAKTSSAPVGDLDISGIKKDWNRVLDAIDTPFIKMSLMDGEPIKYEAQVLTIAFNSGTYLEKVSSSANQSVVQLAFEKIYGQKISLNLEPKKISVSEPEIKTKDNKASAVEMAAEVFGIK